MKVSLIRALLITAAGLVYGSPIAQLPQDQPQGPDPGQVSIVGITYGGTGCPANSVGGVIGADQSFFTLIYSNFAASIGPGVTVTDSRKNCQLNVQLRYPPGWQYSVFTADYRGFASLDPGVTAVQSTNYYFSGDNRQVSTASAFRGPFTAANYLVEDNIGTSSFIWSPCGANNQAANGYLNINQQVYLSQTADSKKQGYQGLMTQDSADGKFTHIVGIQWQRCK